MGNRLKVVLVLASVCSLSFVFSGTATAREAPGCEFPAQDVNLLREVIITNSAPPINDIEADACGNVISYTEVMTRHVVAGPWVSYPVTFSEE